MSTVLCIEAHIIFVSFHSSLPRLFNLKLNISSFFLLLSSAKEQRKHSCCIFYQRSIRKYNDVLWFLNQIFKNWHHQSMVSKYHIGIIIYGKLSWLLIWQKTLTKYLTPFGLLITHCEIFRAEQRFITRAIKHETQRRATQSVGAMFDAARDCS